MKWNEAERMMKTGLGSKKRIVSFSAGEGSVFIGKALCIARMPDTSFKIAVKVIAVSSPTYSGDILYEEGAEVYCCASKMEHYSGPMTNYKESVDRFKGGARLAVGEVR